MATQKKSGLGRGLDALFSNSLSGSEDSVKMAAIDAIIPNPKQPRTLFNEEELNELAASIKEHGIIQPLIVNEKSNGQYTLIAGERRLRAAQIAGLTTVPVICRDADFALFRRFGFQSGRDTDKFEGFGPVRRLDNGTLAVTEGTNAYISAGVEQTVDLGSHKLFIAKVTDLDMLTNAPSATYAYYQEHIKPKPRPVGRTEAGQTVWRCTICGYEFVGEELPEGFICPICKHPASDFEKVVK